MRRIETPERETLSFLTRAWSENKRAQFRWATLNQFSCLTKEQRVFICNIRDDRCHSELKGFDRWRVWRFLTFHESMHLRLTPKGSPAEIVKTYLRKDATSRTENLFRLFEDVRIEVLGLETYVGYLSERAFYDAVVFTKHREQQLEEAERQKLGIAFHSDSTKLNLWWIEFMTQILYRTSILDLKPYCSVAQIQFIIETRDRVYSLKTAEEAVLLARDVDNWMLRNFQSHTDLTNFPDGVPATLAALGGGGLSSNINVEATLQDLGTGSQNIQQAIEGNEDVRGEFDSVEREIEKDNSRPDDASLVCNAFDHGAPSLTDAKAAVPDILSELWDDLMAGTEGVVTRLKSTLRRWKVGWKEVLAEEGDDLDAEAPILFKLRRNGDQPKIFLDERKVGTRGKILVLVDASGSIQQFREAYLRASGVIAEALSFVGSSFELYCFNKPTIEGVATPHLWLIKTFNERWSTEQRERMAGMLIRGDTPLHSVLRLVHDRAKRLNVRRLVILTDGNPDSISMATEEVRSLVRDGIRVLFLGVRNANQEMMRQMLAFKNASERVAYIDELEELPTAFFRLLQAS